MPLPFCISKKHIGPRLLLIDSGADAQATGLQGISQSLTAIQHIIHEEELVNRKVTSAVRRLSGTLQTSPQTLRADVPQQNDAQVTFGFQTTFNP